MSPFTAQAPLSVIPPAGDETTTFRTLRIAYSESHRLLETAVLHGADWIWVGQTAKLRRMVSAAELVAESEGANLELAVAFRNLRLFPHPARHPVRVLAGSAHRHQETRVILSPLDSETVIAESRLNHEKMALLPLPADAIFPMSGHLRLESNGKILDEHRIEAKGVQGLYPGDVYNAMTGLFYI